MRYFKTQFFCTYLSDRSCGPVRIETLFPFLPWLIFRARLKLRLFFNKDVKFKIIAVEWSIPPNVEEKKPRYQPGDGK